MVGHKTVMRQRGFTTLEDPDASPVAVALQHSLSEKTVVSGASVYPLEQTQLTILSMQFCFLLIQGHYHPIFPEL